MTDRNTEIVVPGHPIALSPREVLKGAEDQGQCSNGLG